MQLTMGEILELVAALKRSGMTMNEIEQMPIYIGDDDELNGIHCAWCVGTVDANATDETSILLEMINETPNNNRLEKGKAIVIT